MNLNAVPYPASILTREPAQARATTPGFSPGKRAATLPSEPGFSPARLTPSRSSPGLGLKPHRFLASALPRAEARGGWRIPS